MTTPTTPFVPYQIELVTGILRLIDEKAKAAGYEELGIRADQMNAVCQAATDIVKAFADPTRPAVPEMGLNAWLNSHDTGASSKAMAHHLCQPFLTHPGDMKAHPWDADDFGRCHRFLEAVPGTREKISLMVHVSPTWAALVTNWDELTALYLEELPSGKFPKFSIRIQQLHGVPF